MQHAGSRHALCDSHHILKFTCMRICLQSQGTECDTPASADEDLGHKVLLLLEKFVAETVAQGRMVQTVVWQESSGPGLAQQVPRLIHK